MPINKSINQSINGSINQFIGADRGRDMMAEFIVNGTFTRASTGTDYDIDSILQTYAINVARFGYNPATAFYLGLLTEASATTLQEYSEDFSNGLWGKVECTVDSNTAVAPDGNMTMDLTIPSTNNTNNFIFNLSSVTSGQTYTQSVFVKAGGYDFVQLTGSVGFGTTYANFDLTDGTVGNTDGGVATIQDVDNGIYRLTYTIPATSTTSGRIAISVLNADTASRLPVFIGDGTSGVHLWGANFVNAPSVSSYMKSEAVAVTRATETAVVPWTPGSQYSLVGEFTIPPLDGNGAQAVIRADAAGSFDDMIRIKQTTSVGQLQLQIRGGGVTVYEKTVNGLSVGSQVKFALLVEQGNISFILNGVTQAPDIDTGGALPSGIDFIGLGCAPNGTQQLGGHLKTLNIFDTILKDTQGIG